MIFHTLKWGAFIGFVAAGGVTVIFNVHKNDPTSWALALAAFAGAVKSLMPATAIVQDSPVLSETGKRIATNVSTTSTAPIMAPAPTKGNS